MVSNPNAYLGLTTGGHRMGLGSQQPWPVRRRQHPIACLDGLAVRADAELWRSAPGTMGSFFTGERLRKFANDIDFCSLVVPIDLEQGVALNRTGSDAFCYSNQIPWFLCISNQTLYLPDSLGSGTNLNVFPVNNPAGGLWQSRAAVRR